MRCLPAVCLFLLIACGCDEPGRRPGAGPTGTVQPGRTATTLPNSATAGPLSPSAIMATVNGKPIYMEDLYVSLLESSGLRIPEMLIVNALVNQEAGRTKTTVTDEEVAAENDRSLKGILGDKLTPDQRERMLDQLLKPRGLTRKLWFSVMRRNALLRKMVISRAVVSESMIKVEFARLHGEKVQISHIQLPNLFEAEKIIKLLKEGKDFADLARKYSTNTTTAKNGGTLPPFSREYQNVPRAIRDVAFSLEKVGRISGIVQVGDNFNVLKLLKRIEPPQVDYEAVKEKVRLQLHRRLIERLQVEKRQELQRKARIEYINPILKKAANRPSAR